MTTIIYPADSPESFKLRLHPLGYPAHTFDGENITDLNSQSAEMVYVIPIQMTKSEGWVRLRVKLAEANRYYVVVVAALSTAELAHCLRDGAHDVLWTEDHDRRWHEAIMNASTSQKLWVQLYGGRPLGADDVLIGRSESMQRLRQTIDRLGPTDVCVLIQGESGVGKERVAAGLHKAGNGKSFVALNCAAIPKDLLESELFGVEKGAFTGAMKARAGLVEQADGGTLFLDEIGEMDLGVQPKLLRFLETRRARRVGGEREYTVKVRVISATNRVLDTEIAENRFRADLYYRLAEIILHAPPLRTRPEDIPELSLTFMHKANERFGKNFERLDPALVMKFQEYAWPGNVRELKSTIDRMVLLFDGPIMREPWWEMPASRQAEQIRITRPVAETASEAAAVAAPTAPTYGAGMTPMNTKQKLELARKLLLESDNNYSWVAGQLGVNSSTLWRWRKAGKIE